MSKYKEFWIDLDTLQAATNYNSFTPDDEPIHVIDYQAYLDLQKKLHDLAIQADYNIKIYNKLVEQVVTEEQRGIKR